MDTEAVGPTLSAAKEIWNVISPFVAAFFASILTYKVGIRQTKTYYIIQRQLQALQELYTALTLLRHYCENFIDESDDIGPITPDNTPHSALMNANNIRNTLSMSAIFIPLNIRRSIDDFLPFLSLLSSMELSPEEFRDKCLYETVSNKALDVMDQICESILYSK